MRFFVPCHGLCNVPNQRTSFNCVGHVFSRLLACAGVGCSPEWAYYVGRLVEGVDDDSSVSHWAAAVGLETYGVSAKTDNPSPLPVSILVRNAMPFEEVKAEILGGKPLGLIIKNPELLYEVAVDGLVAGLREEDFRSVEADLEGHSVVACGFSDEFGAAGGRGSFFLQSSYGKDWKWKGGLWLDADLLESDVVQQFVSVSK